jgi:hypothetical protein
VHNKREEKYVAQDMLHIDYIRSYHVYKEVWETAIGIKVLICEREPDNASNRYAVAVKRESTIVGHKFLPRKIQRVCSLLLQRGGSITCTATGHRRYSTVVTTSARNCCFRHAESVFE